MADAEANGLTEAISKEDECAQEHLHLSFL